MSSLKSIYEKLFDFTHDFERIREVGSAISADFDDETTVARTTKLKDEKNQNTLAKSITERLEMTGLVSSEKRTQYLKS